MLNEMQFHRNEVTPLTMAILPDFDSKGNTNTCILEESGQYHVTTPPTKVIDLACKFFGSSLQGRLAGTKDISNITHKAPIVIDPSSGMYFFPTTSPKNKKCSWISHSHIVSVRPLGKDATEIVFKNGESIHLDISHGSMMNQIQRTAQFRYSLEYRMNKIRKITEKNA